MLAQMAQSPTEESPAAKRSKSGALEKFRGGAKKAMLMWVQKAVTK